MSGPEERMRSAAGELRRAGKLLESPSVASLADCTLALEHAEAELRECLSAAPKEAARTALWDGAAELRRSAAHVGLLLETAGSYHGAWIERLRIMTGGYAANGAAAPMAHAGRLSLEG